MSSINDQMTTELVSKRSGDDVSIERIGTNHTDIDSMNPSSRPNIDLLDSIDKKNHNRLRNTVIDHDQTVDVNILRTTLETFPNELFRIVALYMNQPVIVYAFFGLNRRFNSIVFESVRHLNVPTSTELSWFVDCMPHIQNAIETMRFDISLVPLLFPYTYSYPNLRSVILKDGCNMIVKLNVKGCSALGAIISCLNLLRICNIWGTASLDNTLLFDPNINVFNKKNASANALVCPVIQCATIPLFMEEDLIYFCDRASNLMYLKIVVCPDYHNTYHTTIRNPVPKLAYLTQLHMDFDEYDTDFDSIEWLIASCQTCLQQLTITVQNMNPQNIGERLEKSLQLCQHLKKLAFVIEYDVNNDDIDMAQLLSQFQSDWWLDDRRPSVLLQHDNNGRIVIASMPCTSYEHVPLSTNFMMRQLNKGQ